MGKSALLYSLSCRENNDWAIDIMSNIENNQCTYYATNNMGELCTEK